MNNFHLQSFGIGLGTGLVTLLLVAGGMHLVRGNAYSQGGNRMGQHQQDNGAGHAPNTARMAERLGISEDELKKELASGKTMQDIAKEHGVEMPMGGRNRMMGSGAMMGASGSMTRQFSSSSAQ